METNRQREIDRERKRERQREREKEGERETNIQREIVRMEWEGNSDRLNTRIHLFFYSVITFFNQFSPFFRFCGCGW